MFYKEKILFSKEECDKIISYANNWHDREISVEYQTKQSKVGGKMLSHTLIWSNKNMWFVERILDWVNTVLDIEKIVNNNIFAAYRNYKSGDFFVKHDDHIKNGAERIYTIGIHLNSKDDFIGGDFKIYNGNNETVVDFETGKVYIFKSSTPHSVDMITDGNRITLMLFIEKQNLSNEIAKPKSII
jgi:predicted 2-oxoglutarate/Fe(II)-dependent dioxygenase YbiX